MGAFSIWHWVIVLAVVLVLFGGKGKISALMGDFGKGLKSFKKGMKDEEFKLLNDMSHVGSLLTKLGNAFGPKLEKDFTAEDMNLIARFMKKEIDIPQMR